MFPVFLELDQVIHDVVIVTWESKKQTMIVLSLTEAEYMVLSEASHKAMWL